MNLIQMRRVKLRILLNTHVYCIASSQSLNAVTYLLLSQGLLKTDHFYTR